MGWVNDIIPSFFMFILLWGVAKWSLNCVTGWSNLSESFILVCDEQCDLILLACTAECNRLSHHIGCFWFLPSCVTGCSNLDEFFVLVCDEQCDLILLACTAVCNRLSHHRVFLIPSFLCHGCNNLSEFFVLVCNEQSDLILLACTAECN